jgi:SAM-dependent methyltransferase
MKERQREQVLDNAKYLREVRPIDPEEIYEYVEGQPHPAAVRQVLREAAADLGLVEREDGRFEPASEDPIAAGVGRVESLPDRYSRRLEELLVEAFGPGWPDGTSGDRLRAKIRDFKDRYLAGAPVTYDEVTALGYAIYHLPAYFAATEYLLSSLAADDLLAGHLRVLDVGAGVGGPALALEDLLPADTLVDYHAVEPSDAADVLDGMLAETGPNFHATVHRDRIEDVSLSGQFDLVLCANVLSELDDPIDVLSSVLDVLAEDGTILAIAPADRQTAIGLREIERDIERERGATVYAPTVRLWPGETPSSQSWSFDCKPDIEMPVFQRRLDEGERSLEGPDVAPKTDDREPGDGEFVNTDVQYAYSMLRRDGRQAIEFEPDPDAVAKMAEMDEHVTERIDCVGIKLSNNLAEEGNSLFLLGDGSQQTDHFAVLTEASALNRALSEAAYGDLLFFENTLVLWNDDEQAYNFVVDGETIVERVPT